MEYKYIYRPIEEKDLDIIDSWWVGWNEKPIQRDLLPDNGYGGLVVELNGNIIAATYIYLTNSNMAHFDYLVSDPNHKGSPRWMKPLFEKLFQIAKNAGYREVWGLSRVRGVARAFKRYGCVVSDKSYHMIYANDVVLNRINN